MARILCVWFPDWRLRRPDTPSGEPCQVVDDRNRVIACNEIAATAGVAIGMQRRSAEAVCPTVVTLASDPAAETIAFEPILGAIEAVVPRVEPTEPGLAYIPLDGAVAYYGGETATAERIAKELDAIDIDGYRLGIAAGPFSARHAALRATAANPIFIVDDEASFLASLDVSVIDHDDLVATFRWLGIRTLGEVAGLPREAVVSRFGTVGLHAHRVATGEQRRTTPRDVPDDPRVTELFDPPLDNLEQAAFVSRSLASRLIEIAHDTGAVPHRVEIDVEAADGTVRSRTWRTADPFDEGSLAERVRWQLRAWLDSVSGGLRGGLVRITITPADLSGTGRQLGLHEDAASAAEVDRALVQTQALVGMDNVLQARPQGGRDPLDRVSWHRWGEEPSTLERDLDAPWRGQVPGSPPALTPPEPPRLEVEWDTGMPVRVRLGSRWEPVLSWAGPWRRMGRWWLGEEAADRYQLVTSAGAFLCEVRDGLAYLTGVYD
ncbi:MAG: DNA polymerase Y family protein [Acidimicrobiia bacterium]|nr:DNA polymerase Y family protein [Acidimicrobiia bacterium]